MSRRWMETTEEECLAAEEWAAEAGWLDPPRSRRGPSHRGAYWESAAETTPRTPPTVAEVVGRGQAHFSFVPIRSSIQQGAITATFWVLDDALKWVVPNSSSVTNLAGAEAFIAPSHDDPMLAKHAPRLQNAVRRTWRLPCSAREAQAAADIMTVRQADLPDTSVAVSSSERKASLLLTPHLHNLRYAQADLKVGPQSGLMDMNAKQGLFVASNEHNSRVNKAAQAVLAAGGVAPPRNPQLLADPGKIWAITYDMGTVRTTTCEKPPKPANFRYAVNHGWHNSNTSIVQNAGKCHDAGHTDYSQTLLVVAGWCELSRPGQRKEWVTTASIYTSSTLGALATGGGPTLTKIRYDW